MTHATYMRHRHDACDIHATYMRATSGRGRGTDDSARWAAEKREKALKSTIKAHYNITPPDLEYHSTGHEWIGREVRRTFNIARGQKKTVVGAITGWLPADGDDPAIWHVTHVDGDEEDLE